MEQFQVGLVRSIAAAAGCDYGTESMDDGIDAMITRNFSGNTDSLIQVQLKAVSGKDRWNADRTQISAKLQSQRCDAARLPLGAGNIVRRIIVIMDQPACDDDWMLLQGSSYLVNNHCYWVCLEGYPEKPPQQNMVTIHAPIEQVFDDMALCAIMEKVRKGLPL